MKLQKFVLEDFVKEPFEMKALFCLNNNWVQGILIRDNFSFGLLLYDFSRGMYEDMSELLDDIKFYIPLD